MFPAEPAEMVRARPGVSGLPHVRRNCGCSVGITNGRSVKLMSCKFVDFFDELPEPSFQLPLIPQVSFIEPDALCGIQESSASPGVFQVQVKVFAWDVDDFWLFAEAQFDEVALSHH